MAELCSEYATWSDSVNVGVPDPQPRDLGMNPLDAEKVARLNIIRDLAYDLEYYVRHLEILCAGVYENGNLADVAATATAYNHLCQVEELHRVVRSLELDYIFRDLEHEAYVHAKAVASVQKRLSLCE